MAVTATSIFFGFDRILGKIIVQDTTDYAAQGIVFGPDVVKGFIKLEYDAGNGYIVIYNNLAGVTEDLLPPGSIDFSSQDIPLDSDGKPIRAKYRVTYLVNITGSAEYTNQDEFEYEYTFTDPEICIDTAVDCASSSLTSVDITDYDTGGVTAQSITRAHTHYAPPTSGISDTTANLVTLVSTPIAQTTWTVEVIATVVYQQDDGLNIVVEFEGIKEVQVVCDTKLSKVLCCLTQIDKTYQNYLTKNPTKAANYAETVVKPTWHYITLFLAATQAGNATKAASAYQNILDYSGCDGCGCNDEATLVVATSPNTPGGTYVVDSPGNTIDVTQEVAGSVTTFHLEVGASIMNIINNISSLVSVAGDGTYLTVVQTGTAPVLFTVSYTGPVIHTHQKVQKRFKIAPYDPLSFDPNYMVLTCDEIYNAGANVAATPHTYQLGLSSPNGLTDLAIIRVTNFLNGGTAKNFIATAQINRRWDAPTTAYYSYSELRAEVFHTDLSSSTGLCLIRILDSQNNPMPLSKLNSMMFGSPTYISLDITIEP